MATLTILECIERNEKRISKLKEGKEIDAKHINLLLTKERQREFAGECEKQQALRKVKKTVALNTDETLHRRASALMARCVASGTSTIAK